jgi:hypothetical protein
MPAHSTAGSGAVRRYHLLAEALRTEIISGRVASLAELRACAIVAEHGGPDSPLVRLAIELLAFRDGIAQPGESPGTVRAAPGGPQNAEHGPVAAGAQP